MPFQSYARRAEWRCARDQRALKRALDLVDDGVAIVSDTRIVSANAAFRRDRVAVIDALAGLRAAGGGVRTIPGVGEVRVERAGRRWLVVVRRGPALAEAAHTDPLTRMPNRRGFGDRLVGEMARARRHRRPLTLAILDLDRFKSVNDRFGHPAGDGVLRELAGRLSAAARPGDALARIGGEEFAWLLPDVDAVQAISAVDRVRVAIAGQALGPDVWMTATVGVCDIRHAPDGETLYARADEALYWGKRHGRDLTLLWGPGTVSAFAADDRARLAEQADARAGHAGHGHRVADLSVALAAVLDWPPYRQARLHEAALLHDLGNAVVPESLLTVPGPLGSAAIRHIRQHSVVGASMAAPAVQPEVVAWIRHHHERWDGEGYPDGLAGDKIPDGAQLLALADAFHAMIGERPFHRAVSVKAALAEVDRESGAQFRPDAGMRLRDALRWLRGSRTAA